MKKIKELIISILLAQSAGLVGSIFTMSQIDTWYATLIKPEWNPPSWVFGPVWTLLFTLMGISAWMIWKKKKKKGAMLALKIYGVHLVLNALWSLIFFGLESPMWAFAEILVLLAFIIVMTKMFWKIEKKAGVLLLPYIAWVSFATCLNLTIWMLNSAG